MADFRQAMMEKFRRMKARQKEARDAAQNRKDAAAGQKRNNAGKGEKKKRDKEERDKEENSIRNIFSLRSRREKKKKKAAKAVETKSKRERRKAARKKVEEDAKKAKARDYPATDAQKENYTIFLMEIFALGVDGILQQYQTYLKTYVPPNATHTAFDNNFLKNRYKDVICIDETRVVLQNRESDYIHANYVRGDPLLNSFICTQGPLDITAGDFWAMVIQEKVSNIIMLCSVLEAGKNKCCQYWPEQMGTQLIFGDITVKNAETDENKDTTYILSILEAQSKDSRLVVKHLRWKNWPDKGVPSSVMAPFRILKVARQSLQRPTVVHCSAGIGRTGCIVAIELGLQQILSGKPLSVVQLVKRLRSMRMSSIQTDDQLVYVVRCLVAYAEICGIFTLKPELQLQEKAEKFINDYDALMAARKAAAAAAQPAPAAEAAPAPPGIEATDNNIAQQQIPGTPKEEIPQKSPDQVVLEKANDQQQKQASQPEGGETQVSEAQKAEQLPKPVRITPYPSLPRDNVVQQAAKQQCLQAPTVQAAQSPGRYGPAPRPPAQQPVASPVRPVGVASPQRQAAQNRTLQTPQKSLTPDQTSTTPQKTSTPNPTTPKGRQAVPEQAAIDQVQTMKLIVKKPMQSQNPNESNFKAER